MNQPIVIYNPHAEKKDYEIYSLNSDSLDELDKWLGNSQGLFQTKKVFFTQNLLSKKENREKFKTYDTTDKDIEIIIWEEKIEDRVAQFFFKNAKIYGYKLPTTIFKLLDSLYPNNLKQVNSYYSDIRQTIDENIIFFMVAKRMRELLLLQRGEGPGKKLASWQIAKLNNQAKQWDKDKLTKCYESLFRIDMQNKTSINYYSLSEALDILFCYYVR